MPAAQPCTRLPRRRARAGIALALAATVFLAGCGGDDDDKGPNGTDAGTEQSPSAGPAYSPLTGEQVESQPANPIVVVKIDNSHASAPQLGLGKADLVTEELVEGGITRLAVFFDQSVPKVVGPVRSMRATDIGIVSPAKAVLVASGGAGPTVRRIKDAKIKTFTEGAAGFFRQDGRIAPYNLMMRLPELVKKVGKGGRPESYLPFARPGDPALPTGKKAKGLDAVFSGGSTTSWMFSGGTYTNTNSFASEGDRFEPDTVLVLRVKVGDAGYKDPAGNPVPETHFTGKGAAMVFSGGRVVRGTWQKDDYDADLTLSAKGKKLLLPPGKVWVELVPARGGNVLIRRG